MHAFEFTRAKSVAEAQSAAQSDDEAQFLSGGQTLLPTMKQRLAAPSRLISLLQIPELIGVTQSGETIEIGAATPHVRVSAEVSKTFPALSKLAGGIGDPMVRNRGTIGGSLANNDPSACYPSATMACGATIVTDQREIAADDYFCGLFHTALEPAEMITAVRFPVPKAAHYAKFEQAASRFALVGVFVAQYAEGVRVAVTGASEDGVFRWSDAEAALSQSFAPEAIEGLRIQEDGLIGDLHGSKAYRAQLIHVLTARAVAAAVTSAEAPTT